MPYTSSSGSRRRSAAVAAAAAGVWLAACSYVPPPSFPRPALPAPPAVSARYALPEPPRLLHLDQRSADGVVDGELACGTETIRFHLHRTPDPDRPMVLLVPILAGGDDLMRGIARRIVAAGFQAAWCDRVAAALCPPQRGADLEQLFQRTVLHQRALLAWVRHGAIPAPPATFALGVSMGGMIAAALAAVEPDLDGVAICLAGADLPGIVLDSDESRVVHWRQWRMTTDGIGTATLRQELQQTLLSDPARLAPFATTERILLVHATLDEVVRTPHQDLLWEALGRPRRILIPLGHYTSALAIDSIIASVTAFFRERRPAVPVARA
jgi:pimeloyl-ACP methyl ester carboxylesterase